jgi:hypothetical protein
MAETHKTPQMICPDCKVEMNYHAEKLDYMAAETDPDALDPDLDGILEEVHACPRCGQMGTRRAQ